MVELSGGDARFVDDYGAASPAVSAAMAAYADGTGTEHAVLASLAGSRLLVPVVAMPGDGADPEHRSEMATPSLVGRDGRAALVAFTSADAVRRWQPAARPVPVPAAAVFASAADTGAVVIDVAGPVPLAVDGARLAALAAGEPVPFMHEDPDVWRLVATAAGRVAPGIRVRLSPAGPGTEFTLDLAPPPGAAGLVSQQIAVQVAGEVRTVLAGRVRSGIAVALLPG